MVDAGGERPAGGGPPAWLILLVTAVAATAVVGGIVGYRAWRDDDEAAGGEAAPIATVAPPTTAAAVPADRLFTRRTAIGIELRVDVRRDERFAQMFGLPDDERLPAVCRVTGQAAATAISADEVIQAFAPITEQAAPEPTPVPMGSLMGIGGGSLNGFVLQVPDSAVNVRLTAPGASDEMAPVEGIAAVAVPVGAADLDDAGVGGRFEPVPPGFDDLTLLVRHGDGRTDVVRGDGLFQGPLVWRGAEPCFPPFDGAGPPATVGEEDDPFAVRLPPPGEQPADPAAAEAAIDGAMQALYGAPATDDVYALVDDPFAMRETFARIGELDVGVEWSEVEVAIEEVVFLSPVEAAFEYTIRGPGAFEHDEQFGRGRLVDGTWRIGRGTICRDLQESFATTCPP